MTFAECFDKAFPYYLAIGMPPAEFWDGDPWLAKAYRTAHRYRIEQRNQELWMQGVYIYQAFNTVVGNALRKKGHPPDKYLEKPIELFPKEDYQKEIEAKKEREKAVDFFNKMKANWERKHGSHD